MTSEKKPWSNPSSSCWPGARPRRPFLRIVRETLLAAPHIRSIQIAALIIIATQAIAQAPAGG
jgi:hypothetical protein